MTAWFGDSKAHAIAGAKGGKMQGWKTNPSNWRNNRKGASKAGKVGGKHSVEAKKLRG